MRPTVTDQNGKTRTVQLGDVVHAYTGPAMLRDDAGTVITRTREGVRLRFEDGAIALAFAVGFMPGVSMAVAA